MTVPQTGQIMRILRATLSAGTLNNSRWPLPDTLRGLAIVLMISFHGWYNLSVFQLVEMDFEAFFWRSFRALIVGLFCLTAGASLAWSHKRRTHWLHWQRRVLQLVLSAAAITVFSLFAYPGAWVYFGILHFFVIAYLVSLPLIRLPLTAVALGIALILIERAGLPLSNSWFFDLLQPVLGLPDQTLDRMYLLPWLGVFWVGMGSAGWPGWQYSLPRIPGVTLLRWLGQHPLTLYLVHQPVLFGVTALLFSQ